MVHVVDFRWLSINNTIVGTFIRLKQAVFISAGCDSLHKHHHVLKSSRLQRHMLNETGHGFNACFMLSKATRLFTFSRVNVSFMFLLFMLYILSVHYYCMLYSCLVKCTCKHILFVYTCFNSFDDN